MTSADERARGFLRPYAEIFRVPRAWRFSVAGIIGRMPMSRFGLGTVLLISAGTGQYGVAGSASAAGSAGMAVRRNWRSPAWLRFARAQTRIRARHSAPERAFGHRRE